MTQIYLLLCEYALLCVVLVWGILDEPLQFWVIEQWGIRCVTTGLTSATPAHESQVIKASDLILHDSRSVAELC